MRYRVQAERSARKAVEKLPIDVARRLVARYEELMRDPRPPGVKKLSGKPNTYRVRVGDYRVVYRIEDGPFTEDRVQYDGRVTIDTVGHRRDVYA